MQIIDNTEYYQNKYPFGCLFAKNVLKDKDQLKIGKEQYVAMKKERSIVKVINDTHTLRTPKYKKVNILAKEEFMNGMPSLNYSTQFYNMGFFLYGTTKSHFPYIIK